MQLTLGITLAVLGAGFLHASWNALLKSSVGGDAFLDTASVVAGSSLCALGVVAFVPFPPAAAWPFIAASSVVHFGYYVTLAQAYRTGDLSFAYPLMRGSAPLLVTILGSIVLRELPSVQMTVGIVLISLGIVSIAFVRSGASLPASPVAPARSEGIDGELRVAARAASEGPHAQSAWGSRPNESPQRGRRVTAYAAKMLKGGRGRKRPTHDDSIHTVNRGGRRRHPTSAVVWAFANAVIIATYTLIDGAGARASGNAASYVAWLIFLEGIPFVVWVIVRRGRPAWAYLSRGWRTGIVGGACSLAAYGIVLWAMTRAPIAAVAALRETSVLFAALMGSIWLKEGYGWRRLAGAASVVAGIAAMKL